MGRFSLDVSTIIFLLSVGNLMLGSAILAYRRLSALERSSHFFLAGKLLQSIAWLLLWFRGSVPDIVSVVVGNGLLLVGISCETYAIGSVEAPDAVQRRLYAAYAAAGVTFLALFPMDPALRVVIASLSSSAIYASLAFFVMRRNRTPLRAFIGCASLLFAAILGIRAYAAAHSSSFNLFTPAAVQSLTFLALVLILVVGGAGFFFIIKERDDRMLRESEEKYRSVAENASEAIGIIQDGVYVYANKVAERLASSGRKGLVGQSLGESIWPEDRELVRENYRRRIAGEAIPAKYEMRLIGPDGCARWTNLSVSRIEWNGRPAVLALLTDIDELKRREARIESLLADRDLLLREVNHRVKNNLAVAVSLLSLQNGTQERKSADDILRDAQSRLRAMSELYESLNKFGSSAELPVGDYLRSLADEILVLFPREKPVRLVLEFDPIMLGSDLLSSVGLLVNETLTNSLKHAFAGVADPELRVSARLRDEKVELICADNGVGFDASSAGAAPSGFGLQVIAMLSRQLGAAMSVSSDRGTSWRFSFPLRRG